MYVCHTWLKMDIGGQMDWDIAQELTLGWVPIFFGSIVLFPPRQEFRALFVACSLDRFFVIISITSQGGAKYIQIRNGFKRRMNNVYRAQRRNIPLNGPASNYREDRTTFSSSVNNSQKPSNNRIRRKRKSMNNIDTTLFLYNIMKNNKANSPNKRNNN